MPIHDNLQRELDRLKNTESVRLQNDSFSTLLQSITEFVAQVKEEEALVGQIDKLNKRRKVLTKQVAKEVVTEDEQAELEEVLGLLEEAKSLKNTIKAKRAVLKSLKKEVKNLLKAIRT